MTLTQMVINVLENGAPVPTPDLELLTCYTKARRTPPIRRSHHLQITDRMRREAAARARGTPRDCQ
jgi:hypothetical protein